jgi:Zn-dependent protease
MDTSASAVLEGACHDWYSVRQLMFLGPSWKIVTVRGIPIRLHFTLVLVLPLLPWRQGWLFAPALGVGLFASIVLHELGHALVALRYGCGVREILLLPIGGAARLEQMPRRPRQEFWMALAGPGVSLLLGAVLLAPVFLDYWGALPWNTPLGLLRFLATAGALNLGLALFNLLPAFPMDGGRVLRAALTPRLGAVRATRVAAFVGRGLAVAGVVYGVYDLLHGRHVPALPFVSLFIYWAAGMEVRALQIREWQRQVAAWWFAAHPRRPPDAHDPD